MVAPRVRGGCRGGPDASPAREGRDPRHRRQLRRRPIRGEAARRERRTRRPRVPHRSQGRGRAPRHLGQGPVRRSRRPEGRGAGDDRPAQGLRLLQGFPRCRDPAGHTHPQRRDHGRAPRPHRAGTRDALRRQPPRAFPRAGFLARSHANARSGTGRRRAHRRVLLHREHAPRRRGHHRPGLA